MFLYMNIKTNALFSKPDLLAKLPNPKPFGGFARRNE